MRSHLVAAGDVVVPGLARVQQEVDGGGVVPHEEPVPHAAISP
jgi:hypothetical protein